MTSVSLVDFPVRARKETEESHQATKDLIEQFTLLTTQIQFPVTAVAAVGILVQTFQVLVTDDNDHRMLFGDNVAPRVQIDETGAGTAAGKGLSADGVTYGVADIIITFEKGAATVWARATGTGTVVASLVDIDSTGLTLGGDATVTFS